jgi:hypothetical protein
MNCDKNREILHVTGHLCNKLPHLIMSFDFLSWAKAAAMLFVLVGKSLFVL